MKEVYDKFGLEPTTRDFIGHAMALYQTDEYINEKGMAKETVQRIRLYVNSMARYGKSPYIYPLYGLGELPQGFARLSAIYGGTYMLNTSIDEFEYEGGKVSGIRATMKERSEDTDGMKFSTKAKTIIGDPSYFPGKVTLTGHLLKAICILTHPVPNTENSDSAQIIIPQSQVGRRNGEQKHEDSTQLKLIPKLRHLHCHRLFRAQCLSERILDRHCLHHRRRLQQPPHRTATGLRASGSDRGEVHWTPDPLV